MAVTKKVQAKETTKVLARTPRGKDIQIRHAGTTSMFEICFATGGQLPEELGGLFTDETNARVAINKYLNRKAS